MVVHAEQRANGIVVDGRGNLSLNGADFGFIAGLHAQTRLTALPQATHDVPCA